MTDKLSFLDLLEQILLLSDVIFLISDGRLGLVEDSLSRERKRKLFVSLVILQYIQVDADLFLLPVVHHFDLPDDFPLLGKFAPHLLNNPLNLQPLLLLLANLFDES